MANIEIINDDCLNALKQLPDKEFSCCVTSPPYFGLRDYGHPEQLGAEETIADYIRNLVAVFGFVKEALADDGTLWLNLGDSYITKPHGPNVGRSSSMHTKYKQANSKRTPGGNTKETGLPHKSLAGTPWRVALALQADGWLLRQDIIWCLSGGSTVYARTAKGDMPMTIKDLYRLNPSTVKLWNGSKWTQLLGMNKSKRKGDEIEITLRSGEAISCTPSHKFPTKRGLLEAKDIKIGDTLTGCTLPEPEKPVDCAIDIDAAWLAGLYIAEGSKSGNTIQISGHAKESHRWERVKVVAKKFGGSATRTIDGNSMSIRMYGKVLNAIINELVGGRTAIDKCFSTKVWRYSNRFIEEMLDGYLSGDGHMDGNRWRLGFCRNNSLARDIRVACARLGYKLTLNKAHTEYDGMMVPTFRGEIRKSTSGHHNEKDRCEVVGINKARCRHVYDLGVADEPHVFALSSGVLTHNSKPNAMPESIKDRCTKSHEYVFLFSKQSSYYFNQDAIKEPAVSAHPAGNKTHKYVNDDPLYRKNGGLLELSGKQFETKNPRSVWSINTQPISDMHFAAYPIKLATRCLKAGAPPNSHVLDPFLGSGTTACAALDLNLHCTGIELNKDFCDIARKRVAKHYNLFNRG